MPLWKAFLLNLYYYTSIPYRWWQSVQAVDEHRVPITVLFYHRIADDELTPWTLSNRVFARQVRWLARRFEMISLEEVQHRIRTSDSTRPAVSITFDDGYADNCQQAIPLLIKEGIPCTYFVTLRNVLHGEPFAHDVALGHRLLPNNLEQLRAMAAAGIDIGAHTYSHADIGQVSDPQELYREVVTPGRQLGELVGRPVRYFAFPIGLFANLSPQAFQLAHTSGYVGVCSAYGGYNLPGDDSFHLKRISANNMLRLKNRTTIDPRKLSVPSYPWQPVVSGNAKERG